MRIYLLLTFCVSVTGQSERRELAPDVDNGTCCGRMLWSSSYSVSKMKCQGFKGVQTQLHLLFYILHLQSLYSKQLAHKSSISAKLKIYIPT